MSQLNDITDDDFVPLLKSLGVDTFNKSFEWMLNDPEFSGVLRWIYENVDINNALTEREECRYAELERKGQLLSPEDLENAITELQNEFEGICLPDNQDGLEDVKIDIEMDKERLNMLEKQELILEEMIQHNEMRKNELNIEITKLRASEQQYTEDESSLGKDCLQLATQIESITSDVMRIVGDTLDIFASCQNDKETAKRFLAFGPFEQYSQSQVLFRSHFDLYCSKKLKMPDINTKEDEIHTAIIQAKALEGRLSDAVWSYIESAAELNGERAKLALVSNYSHTHPSQIALYTMEVKNGIEMLEQEESILEQQLQHAAQQLVRTRSLLVEEAAARTALDVRQQIQSNIRWLHNATQEALALDRLLYYAVRRELAALEEVVQFASHLRTFVMQEGDAVLSRIESMNDICYEVAQAETKVQVDDVLLTALSAILRVTVDGRSSVALYRDVASHTRRLRDDIVDAIKKKEEELNKFQSSQSALHGYIWDGSSRAASCRRPRVSAMTHALAQELAAVDATVLHTGTQFASIKNGDKHNLRKLWQWFLTDPAKFFTAIQNVY